MPTEYLVVFSNLRMLKMNDELSLVQQGFSHVSGRTLILLINFLRKIQISNFICRVHIQSMTYSEML